MLIDEPELHLHPILEERVLKYLRNLISTKNVQFIITTHSPTLLNTANFDELYLLSPKSTDVTNQLVRLTDEDSRLDALRILCGDTHYLTASRNIICVEGEAPEDINNKPADKKLLEILVPEISNNIIIPMGGKHKVIEGTKRLRDNLPKNVPRINVFALVDQDQDNETNEEWVFRLPVCMIENLLLKPVAINEFLEKYSENSTLKNLADVERELKTITSELKNDEIRIRIKKQIGFINESFDGLTVKELKVNHQKTIDLIKSRFPNDDKLTEILNRAQTEVESIISENKELDYFRGKVILKKFYEKFLKSLSFSYFVFCMELAQKIAKNEKMTEDIRKIVDQVNSK